MAATGFETIGNTLESCANLPINEPATIIVVGGIVTIGFVRQRRIFIGDIRRAEADPNFVDIQAVKLFKRVLKIGIARDPFVDSEEAIRIARP